MAMKYKFYYILLGFMVMTAMSSCIKDQLYILPEDDPDYFDPFEWKHSSLTVRTIWDEGVTPVPHGIMLNEDWTELNTGTEITFKGLPAQTYSVYAYNTPPGIKVEQGKATVTAMPDGTLNPYPELFYLSPVVETNVVRGTPSEVSLPMIQWLHELKFTFNMWPGDEKLIESIVGKLGGVVPSLDMNEKIPTGETTSINLTLAPTTVTYHGSDPDLQNQEVPAYTVTVRVFDIQPTTNTTLNLELTTTDGQTITISTPVEKVIPEPISTTYPISPESPVPSPTIPMDIDIFIKDMVNGSFNGTIVNWNDVENGVIHIR
jgi:hypothetical protein